MEGQSRDNALDHVVVAVSGNRPPATCPAVRPGYVRPPRSRGLLSV